MTATIRIQDLYKSCALLVMLCVSFGARQSDALEVMGGQEPVPLLLASDERDYTGVAASLGRMVFWTNANGSSRQSVVTATLLSPTLLLTTSHVFYDTNPAPGTRAALRSPCVVDRETRALRWLSCDGMQFIPAFAASASDHGQRAVSHCVHFAAYPGADGLAQQAVCVLARSAAMSAEAMPLKPAIGEMPAVVPFMAQRTLNQQVGDLQTRWDAVVGAECPLRLDSSLLRPGSFAGPSGNAIRHYCAIWSGGSGAPVLQWRAEGGFAIVGIHLGERFKPADVIQSVDGRQFLAPGRFKGRNANVAVGVEQVGVLLDALAL